MTGVPFFEEILIGTPAGGGRTEEDKRIGGVDA